MSLTIANSYRAFGEIALKMGEPAHALFEYRVAWRILEKTQYKRAKAYLALHIIEALLYQSNHQYQVSRPQRPVHGEPQRPDAEGNQRAIIEKCHTAIAPYVDLFATHREHLTGYDRLLLQPTYEGINRYHYLIDSQQKDKLKKAFTPSST